MSSERSFVSDLLVVLRGADFRRLFAVRLASQASDGAFQVGLASLVFFSPDRATTPEAVALAAVVTVLPYTLIGPFAGVLLDAWPRRQVLLFANALRAVMVVGVAILILLGWVGVPLYLAALACLSVNRFFLAGLGASLPHVVPRHELVMANAVSPTCGTIAALLGAGVAFGLRVLLGTGDGTDALVLLVSAVGYGCSAALATRMHRDLLGPDERAPLNWSTFATAGRDVLSDLRDGARHVRDRPRAGRALALIGAHRIGYGIMTIALMLLCRNYFTDPANVDDGLALLARAVTATGLGIAAAALITPLAANRIGPWRWIATCIAAASVIEVAFVAHLGLGTMFFGAFAIGLTGQGAKICVDAVVQETVDDSFRGRVFSFYDVVFNAAFVAAAGLAVLLLPMNGYSRPVFAGVTVLFAVAAVSYLIAERRQELTASTAPLTKDSALDFEDKSGLATEIDASTRSDHGGHPRLDRHR
ncbi:MAG TPA: MFS transporter [Kineosporiaceae bacterium]|nr:MFS transporter [Kineosporiaceae bacterium]